ncbi:MAG: SLBB domain-containing protein, partial [Clostridia bacterium]|nr:SLBB domain-containing protein [Clostridia bacterium]
MNVKEMMQNAGVIGAGGAGFPSYAKLADGADTLLINASECEPLLETDYVLMRDEMPTILYGAQKVMEYAKIQRTFLCLKRHNALRLGLAEGMELTAGVLVKELPDVYPIGDEISMIYQATGRVVRPGNLPITRGVIVYNAETLYNVGRAVRDGVPVTEKWLTIGGDVPETLVVKVPIGMRIRDLFQKFGITVDDDHTVMDGGPSMGKIINYRVETVKKNTVEAAAARDQY